MGFGRGRPTGGPPQRPAVPEIFEAGAPPGPVPASANPGSPALPGDGSYEVVLSALGSIVQEAPGTASSDGTLRVIQGAVSDNPKDGFYAFVSVNDINVPLVSTHKSSRIGLHSFSISIPDGVFCVTLHQATEPSVVQGMEDLLKWFTTWEGAAIPEGNNPLGPPVGGAGQSMDSSTAAGMAGYAPESNPGATGSLTTSADGNRTRAAIDRAGVKGADLVTKYGEMLNTSLKARADASVAAQGDKLARNVKLGGPATANALGTAKTVVGAGAGLAATAIDKVSSAVGSSLANNKVMKSMREAPQSSNKRKAHDLLVSGAMAVGRVYIAADSQGKLIFETAGDGAGRVAGAKYGPEAENAARAAGAIGRDTYRIMRFPQKLTASSLVKGGLKGAAQSHAKGEAQRPQVQNPAAYAPSSVKGAPSESKSRKYYSDSAM